MSKVLFETAYGGDRHVFLDDCVVVFAGERPLINFEQTFKELELPGRSGYIGESYESWLKEFYGD